MGPGIATLRRLHCIRLCLPAPPQGRGASVGASGVVHSPTYLCLAAPRPLRAESLHVADSCQRHPPELGLVPVLDGVTLRGSGQEGARQGVRQGGSSQCKVLDEISGGTAPGQARPKLTLAFVEQ